MSKKENLLKVFAAPERYVQGRNATAQLGEEMKKLGMKGPVIIVASSTPKRLLSKTWSEVLPKAGFEYSIHDFPGVCSNEEAQKIVEAAKFGAKTIVSAGGGQVIDIGRISAHISGCEFVSCPTVASTDAPTSTLCVMYKADRSFDEYRFVRRHPTLVLVDSSMVADAPRRMFVGGLGDALATWYEARSVKLANAPNFLGAAPTETSTALSRLCRDILLEDGPAAVQSVDAGVVTPALERVVEANTLLSGLGFENGGLCVAHSVHNGLTSQPICADYTHGEKVAFGLITQLVLEGQPALEVEQVLDFCVKVGLPVTLAEVGIDASDYNAIKEIAERATAEGESAHCEPFEVNAINLADAIRAADRRGALFKQSKAT